MLGFNKPASAGRGPAAVQDEPEQSRLGSRP
jgi:hypothetical protein